MKKKHLVKHCIKVAATPELHAALDALASDEKVSLNQLVVYLLTKEVAKPPRRSPRTSTEGFDKLFEVQSDAIPNRDDSCEARREA